jgi:alpha-glucosidase
MTQSRVTSRATFISRTAGTRLFPWRVMAIASQDKELLNNDLVFKLAAQSRLTDLSWIKPGKVAWDWWNDWNISHVDFKAGINTSTYKYYIDFAAAHGIEYIVLDEGWAKKGDIMQIIPEIDLQQIIDYGKSKNVGVWLWTGMYPIDAKMDEAFTTYAKMGVKGFKIDFISRDDQKMIRFYYRAAQKAAEHHLMLDFHGACKPTGLMRTYPNVLNYEGVYGLEMAKFPTQVNFPEHAVSIPFIRMLAGSMDYTPGAMRNATRKEFYPSAANPMSQGTRCQQLAMYVVFEAPFEMLADSPTSYMREEECTQLIASIPTVFDETTALDGEVGSYAAIARKKGANWYAGALNNWYARDITIDLSFLGTGNYKADIFEDGINADHAASDYKHRTVSVTSADKIKIHLAPGGGWAAKFIKQ